MRPGCATLALLLACAGAYAGPDGWSPDTHLQSPPGAEDPVPSTDQQPPAPAAQPPPESAPSETSQPKPYPEPVRGARGVMFSRTAAEVWIASLGVLKDLKVRVKVDEADGVAVSELTSVARFKGLQFPELTRGYFPKEIQFYVFVPRLPGPARLYVASCLQASRFNHMKTAAFFDVISAEEWLIDHIEERLGEDGHRIPSDSGERRRLALTLATGPELDDPCLRVEPPARFDDPLDWPTPPVKIPLSEFKPPYDTRDIESRRQGLVEVQALIQEDGAVNGVELTETDPAKGHLGSSALVAIPFWRYRPALWNGCPVEVSFTVMVDFNIRR